MQVHLPQGPNHCTNPNHLIPHLLRVAAGGRSQCGLCPCMGLTRCAWATALFLLSCHAIPCLELVKYIGTAAPVPTWGLGACLQLIRTLAQPHLSPPESAWSSSEHLLGAHRNTGAAAPIPTQRSGASPDITLCLSHPLL